MLMSPDRRALLLKLENIIGAEVFNPHTRHGPLGRGAGCDYCYKVSFGQGKQRRATARIGPEITDEDLFKGRYVFGANELYVFRALERVVRHFEETYRLRVDHPRPYQR